MKVDASTDHSTVLTTSIHNETITYSPCKENRKQGNGFIRVTVLEFLVSHVIHNMQLLVF
jgi:hypothetical protein